MATAEPRERLLALASERGVSLGRLSALIGRNPTYLQQFVRKGSPRKLEETDRRKLARFLGVPEGELGAPEDFSASVDADGWTDIPRLDLGASAGPGALTGPEAPLDAFRFASRWLRAQGLRPAGLSAIAVAGDSMEPTLRDGDEILVDRAAPLRDGIHVVQVDDALLVKRISTGGGERVTLISDNPAYRALELPREAVEVIGRVVWKAGRL